MGEANPSAEAGPRRLICAVQTYDWGSKGEDSYVARLSAKNSGSAVDAGKPYAELWMGTHPSGPSFLAAAAAAVDAGEAPEEEETKAVPLKQWIEENPSVLGKKVAERWGGELPFLFKVLSLGKALSIQAHPDKELARKLHEQQPSVYKDDNHKPEMALALTEFRALCGFVSLEELKDVLIKVPEIGGLVGDEEITNVLGIKEQGESDKVILRSIFTKLMSASKDVVSDAVCKLKGRLNGQSKKVSSAQSPHSSSGLCWFWNAKTVSTRNGRIFWCVVEVTSLTSYLQRRASEVRLPLSKDLLAQPKMSKVRTLTEKEALALVLENQYPADVGVLSCFFLNYVKLSPGEALYLGANEPHAYLSGDCIECMATSDNVVRAGLTPKYVDVQTLCSMLTYKQGYPEILRAIPLNTYLSRYIPPFEEFEVDHCSLPSEKSLVLPAIPGPSIFLVVAGEGKMQVTSSASEEVIRDGHIFFVPAGMEISLSAGSGGALQLYRAGVNSRFFE